MMPKFPVLAAILVLATCLVVVAPSSDSGPIQEVTAVSSGFWCRTTEPCYDVPDRYDDHTVYVSSDPDDRYMRSYLDGEISIEELASHSLRSGRSCYAYFLERSTDASVRGLEHIELESPQPTVMKLSKGEYSLVPGIKTSGYASLVGSSRWNYSFGDVLKFEIYRGGTYVITLDNCPYHCVRFHVDSGAVESLSSMSGSEAHEMATQCRWARGTLVVPPGCYVFSQYAFADGSEEDERFRKEVAEAHTTVVPDWAEDGKRRVITESTRMAFYALVIGSYMDVSYYADTSSPYYEQFYKDNMFLGSHLRIDGLEFFRPDLPDHLYMFAPANKHVAFAFTYDMSCSSVMMNVPGGNQFIAADSRYDMVFEEATLMDFTIGGPLYGGKDLPLSMTVYESSENVPEPDGCAYVAVALGLVVCALVILALMHHGRGPRWD